MAPDGPKNPPATPNIMGSNLPSTVLNPFRLVGPRVKKGRAKEKKTRDHRGQNSKANPWADKAIGIPYGGKEA